MINGGNRKLKDFLTSYGIAINGPDMGWKYRTKAASYYRELVKRLSNLDEKYSGWY